MKGRSGGNAPRPRPLPSEPQGVRHLRPGQQNTPGRGHQHQNCVPDTGSPGSGPGASCRPSRSSEPPQSQRARSWSRCGNSDPTRPGRALALELLSPGAA